MCIRDRYCEEASPPLAACKFLPGDTFRRITGRCHQLGIGYQRGWFREGSARRTWALLLAAAGAIAVLIAFFGYPASAVGFANAPRANHLPPTLAMALLGVAQVAALGLVERSRVFADLAPRAEARLATDRVGEAIDGLTFNGNRDRRLPNISNISFSRIEGEALLINLDMHGIAVSTGSACSSGNLEPSPVIRALGSDEERARSAIRFSFGRFNAEEEVDRLIQVLPEAIVNLRKLSR